MLSLHELYQIRSRRRNQQKQTFQRILDLCFRRIRTAASTGVTDCLYEVPGLVVGLPLFNREECLEFITDALKKIGLFYEKVENLPYTLYISWDPSKVRSPGGLHTQRRVP